MITVLTPTRNRPQAFELLQCWIQRQTYTGRIQWIVINDGEVPYRYRLDQEVILRTPIEGEPHSICMNLLAGIRNTRGGKVLIVEDDDYIAPDYIATMNSWLDDFAMVGGCPAIYYHVGQRKMRNMRNMRHASLGQTGFIAPLLPWFEEVLRLGETGVDLRMWRSCPDSCMLMPNIQPNRRALHVGIKGLPGECGIGIGHRATRGINDDSLTLLRAMIGASDAEEYAMFGAARTLLDQSGMVGREAWPL